MQTDQYTSDAICRSLGIGPFDEPWTRGKPARQLRLLLCPSFAPELCITLGEVEERLALSISAARTQIWSLSAPGLVTVDQDKTVLEALFSAWEEKFLSSLAAPSQAVVVLDGMRTHAVCRTYGKVIAVTDNPGQASSFGRFIADLINATYSAVENPGCRNALARAGHYVGLDLPVEPEVELSPITRLGVLGTPEEQGEILAALAVVAARQPRSSEES